jgi:tetratricopeptide (TPR) repeat protein
MPSAYLYRPADPAVASIVETLTLNLADMPALIQSFQCELEQGKSLAECRDITNEGLESLYTLAAQLCDEAQFEHALPICLNLLIHQPRNPRYQFICASCLQRLGQLQEASVLFDYVLQLDATDAAAAYRLGECLDALGDREQAKNKFNLCIDLSYGVFRYRTIQDLARSKIANMHSI